MSTGFPVARYLDGREAAFIWNGIRLTRADPPMRAKDADRRDTYSAALEQFEQLMHAASSVGAASRPLPLFYAVEQAARAIVVAHRFKKTDDGHGMKLEVNSQDPMKSTFTWFSKGLPQNLVTILGGSGIPTGVELGALWSALPELSQRPLPNSQWPRVLRIGETIPNPPGILTVVAGPQIRLVLDVPSAARKNRLTLEQLLHHYPTLRGWSLPEMQRVGLPQQAEIFKVPMLGGGTGVLLHWNLDSWGRVRAKPDEVAPQYRLAGVRWLLPRLADGAPPPHPLLAWWGLLFGLSILARYHPATWVNALAVNRSPTAVLLENALEEALAAIPHLVFEALIRRQVLIQT